MMKSIRNLFSRPEPHAVIKAELREAHLALLEAQTGFEFAAAMVDYHGRRMKRLQAILEEPKK